MSQSSKPDSSSLRHKKLFKGYLDCEGTELNTSTNLSAGTPTQPRGAAPRGAPTEPRNHPPPNAPKGPKEWVDQHGAPPTRPGHHGLGRGPQRPTQSTVSVTGEGSQGSGVLDPERRGDASDDTGSYAGTPQSSQSGSEFGDDVSLRSHATEDDEVPSHGGQ